MKNRDNEQLYIPKGEYKDGVYTISREEILKELASQENYSEEQEWRDADYAQRFRDRG